MDLYTSTSYQLSRQLTRRYSTSFSLSSRFFSNEIQPHIYAIYGLVRIADEIVDTYKGGDAGELLNELEQHTERAIATGYSTNPIIHSFALTAREYSIDQILIAPFFRSMRLDLEPQTYTDELYQDYIYGSAEVVGLMCLKVFTNDTTLYEELAPGAAALGSAYQKVNFLRDIASDYKDLGRLYFPGVEYETFNEDTKSEIIADIQRDFNKSLPALRNLPPSSRKATYISYVYYQELLTKLRKTPAETIKSTRIRVSGARKLLLLAKALLTPGVKS